MHDLKPWRQLTESWEMLRDARGAAASEDPVLAGRMAEIEAEVAETRRMIDDWRQREADSLRSLRTLSKKIGVAAARPLPSSTPSGPRPDTGPYRIEHCAVAPGPCTDCDSEIDAGPVAWRRQTDPGPAPGPVCDNCLVEAEDPLGAVLLLIHLLREAGGLELMRREDEVVIQTMILTTVGLYQNQHFEGMPLHRVDPETSLRPVLARLRASYRGEDEESVQH